MHELQQKQNYKHSAKHVSLIKLLSLLSFLKKYDVPEHPHFDTLFHIDAYRIEHISEAGPLRLDELFLTPRTLVCLEWPEQIAGILPAVKIQVQLEITENESRKVTITLPKTQ